MSRAAIKAWRGTRQTDSCEVAVFYWAALKTRIFTIPMHGGEAASDELNAFLAGQRIVQLALEQPAPALFFGTTHATATR